MQLLSLEINCFRGIKNLKIDLSGNSIIYGDNGTGKSGVIDAIDFLIKGDITRLTGAGSKNLSAAKHGKFVTEDVNKAWVKAIVSLPQYSEQITIERTLANPSVLICDNNYKKDFEEIERLSHLQAHYLSRREILQFINATDQDRAKSIERLLNLYNLEKNRTLLQKVKKEFDDQLKEKKKEEATYVNNICEKLGVEEKLWLDSINEIRFQLGGKELDDLTLSISSDISFASYNIPRSEISSLLQRFSDIIDLFENGTESLHIFLTEFKGIQTQIEFLANYAKEVQYLSLYIQGDKLINDSKCPLCEQEIKNVDHFKHLLKEKIENLQSSKQLHESYKTYLQRLDQKISNILSRIKQINKELLEKYLAIETLNEIEQAFVDLQHDLTNNCITSKRIDEFLGHEYAVKLKQDYVDELSKLSTQMSLNKKETDYKTLVDLDSKYKILLECRDKIRQLELFSRRASVLFDGYIEAQTSLLNRMYDSIQDRFSELYRLIHSSDESTFLSQFNRKATSLELQVKFKDGNYYPPNAVHSEGHQDSMGICLFFALSEKISNNKLNLILLDDVVMSIDIDHRRGFCKLLKEEFPNKQFIITTHDYIWRRELEKQGVANKRNIIFFKAWDISHGPYVQVGNNIWESIDEYLNAGEKHEAIGALRYYMEEYAQHLCEKYKLKVPYSSTKQWTLSEVLPPVHSFYLKAFKMAKESLQSFGKNFTKAEQICSNFIENNKKMEMENWTVNPSTHFTDWAQNLSINELRETSKVIKSYFDSFECPICHSLLEIKTDTNGNPQNIMCNCGDISFSCIKKK